MKDTHCGDIGPRQTISKKISPPPGVAEHNAASDLGKSFYKILHCFNSPFFSLDLN